MSLHIGSNDEPLEPNHGEADPAMKLARAIDRLSSGPQIARAADAAGLTIDRLLDGELREAGQALESACAAFRLAQEMSDGLGELYALLQRLGALVVDCEDGALSSGGRASMRDGIEQLAFEIGRVDARTELMSRKLLRASTTLVSQAGTSGSDTHALAVTDAGARAATTFSELVRTGRASITEIDAAIDQVSAQRTSIGCVENRLEFAVNNLATRQDDLIASESRIGDTNATSPRIESAKPPALQQAGTAVLAPANGVPLSMLSLLR